MVRVRFHINHSQEEAVFFQHFRMHLNILKCNQVRQILTWNVKGWCTHFIQLSAQPVSNTVVLKLGTFVWYGCTVFPQSSLLLFINSGRTLRNDFHSRCRHVTRYLKIKTNLQDFNTCSKHRNILIFFYSTNTLGLFKKSILTRPFMQFE